MNVYSKIVLFGEYLFKWGGEIISFPFLPFYGKLAYLKKDGNDSSFSIWSNNEMRRYLSSLIEKKALGIIDVSKLQKAVESGLYFNSNIPIGYGVGSSGALVASLYAEFATNVETNTHLL